MFGWLLGDDVCKKYPNSLIFNWNGEYWKPETKGIDFTMSMYKPICDNVKHFYFPFWFMWLYEQPYLKNTLNNINEKELVLRKHLNNENILKEKTDFCGFVAREKEFSTNYIRKNLCIKISNEYKKVSCGGS